ncbi:hypothetical protein [Lonepinella sp. BR2882]|uniref:hypothetical protein n=1 Tax=Lonepinella sp. BR2882 TaxID=3095283 RepID=UPI003F6DAC42
MRNLTLIETEIACLEIRINQLLQPLCLIHIITKSNLDLIEPCELDDSLTGVKRLLQQSIDDLNESVDLLRKHVSKAEIANNPPPTGKSEKVIQPHAGPSKRPQGEE